MGTPRAFIGPARAGSVPLAPLQILVAEMKTIVVIGGGIIGLTTAWSLVEAGFNVRVIERSKSPATGASHANGGQLSYRYVSPLADQGVPLKALKWLLDPDGPLHWRPEADAHQWRWLASFLAHCRAPVNQRTTGRLLALGALSQAACAEFGTRLPLAEAHWRAPGKLVLYRHQKDFDHARARVERQGAGPEQALGPDDCRRVEPALTHSPVAWAGGIFTEGEAVADCHAVCLQLASALAQHPNFEGFVQAEVTGFLLQQRQARAALTDQGPIAGDEFVLAAGIGSRALAETVGIRLPLYPLKGYSLSAPIGAHHHPPEVSVTDFEKKVLYTRIGHQLRVAAMVDLVGLHEEIDPQRLAALQRAVHATLPDAADYAQAEPWAGLRPATPAGAPILGASPVEHLWLNVGHGALGFTFSFGSARILSRLIAGQPSPLPLDGLQLQAA